MNRLSNKVIIVTGGSGLLGRAILKFVRQEGAVGINADISVETNLEKFTVNCDISDEMSVRKLIEVVKSKYSRIDGWVNNAYPRTQDWGNQFEEIEVDSWRKNIDLQLNSIFICSQQVLKTMKENCFGSLINIGSIYGIVGPDFDVYAGTTITMPAAYSAIKGGVVNFTRYLASYFGPFGIRVNCVSPGGIIDNQNEIFIKQYERKVPLKRMGTPEDVASAVAFLLSDESSYISGHNLIVDGGWTCI
jgi:NAD(P)-dependent dehydrogenase (short-subunit alcohol dehydrogenase family)